MAFFELSGDTSLRPVDSVYLSLIIRGVSSMGTAILASEM